MLGNRSNPTKPRVTESQSSEFDEEGNNAARASLLTMSPIETVTLDESDELNVASLDDIGDEVRWWNP